MALGSKKRDYVTSARLVEKRLALHFQFMNEYIQNGMEKDEASKKAFKDIQEGRIK